MTTTPRKTGRPRKPHVAADGSSINGLRRRSNGRWVIVATGETFREPNERLAIARFRQWEAKNRGGEAYIDIPISTATDPADAEEETGLMEWLVRNELGPGEHRAEGDDSLVLRIPANADPIQLLRAIPEATLYAYFAQQIHDRKQYVAQMTGIEQIGYIDKLQKPDPSPTLTEVGELFWKKKISDNWMSKCKAFWQEFQEQIEVATLREVTQEHLLDYEEMVMEAMREAGLSSTYARQRYQAVKSVLNYPPKRGKWAEDCQRVKAYAAVLMPPPKSATDPHPIDQEHFNKLLNAADEQLTAMLLMMLNACMYGGEVASLDWSELNLDNGTLATNRQKTGVVRIAVLWPRTVDAFRKLHRTTDAIFLTNATKMRHNYQTVYKAFKAARKSAGLVGVQLSHVRDGAYTAAVEAGVEFDRVKLLAGHETGISDAYVKRRPSMVAAACEAIQAAYFGPAVQ